MSRCYRFERVQHIPRPRAEVFPFFADALNLERITPGFLRFRVLTPAPIALGPGTLIDYRLSLFGVPIAWRTEIETFDPPHRFSDRQLRGPYRHWYHRHTFFDEADGTRMVDQVEYEIPWGIAGRLARGLFVARTLEAIFDYRRDQIAALFPPRSEQAAPPLPAANRA